MAPGFRGEGQSPLSAAVAPSKTKLSARFELKDTGPLTIVLKDTEGFSSQEKDAVRYDVRSDKDEAPKVMIDDPANDRDVTPNADLPVEMPRLQGPARFTAELKGLNLAAVPGMPANASGAASAHIEQCSAPAQPPCALVLAPQSDYDKRYA